MGITREPEDVLYPYPTLYLHLKYIRLNCECVYLTHKHTFAEVRCVSEEVGENVDLSADARYQDHSLCLAETAEWM